MTRRSASAFTTLCLLTGSAWILDAALPAALPGTLGLLVDNAILALVFYLPSRELPASNIKIFAYAALVLAVPGALATLSDGHLSSTTIVLIYTLVPAATIFLRRPVFELRASLRASAPALAALAGAALILPVHPARLHRRHSLADRR